MRIPRRRDGGQASLELLGILPLLFLGLLAALQIAFTVSAVEATTTAARAAARATSTGASADAAARAAVPGWVAQRMTVVVQADGVVAITSRIPIIVPLRGFPNGPEVSRRAYFPPERP